MYLGLDLTLDLNQYLGLSSTSCKKGNQMKKVLVFGSLNSDLSIECKGLPLIGETTIGEQFQASSGGKGANQAVACARMGVHTYMVGKIGEDRLGAGLIASLQQAGVDTRRVRTTKEVSSGTAMIIRVQANNCIIVDPGANACVTFEEVKSAIDTLLDEGDIFLTQFECSYRVSAEALAYAHARKLTTICNPSPAHAIDDATYQSIDILCLNEVECKELSGIEPVDDESAQCAIEFFAQKGVGRTIITLGEHGSSTMIDSEFLHVSAHDVPQVDTTGAGDTYLGCLAACKALGFDERKALEMASTAASLSVTRLGAQTAIPTFDQVNYYMETGMVSSPLPDLEDLEPDSPVF